MNRAKRGHEWGGLTVGIIAFMMMTVVGCMGGSDTTQPAVQSAPLNQPGENAINGMNLGEVQFLDFGSGQGVDLNFDSNSAEDTYLAVLHSNNVREGAFNVVIQGSSSATVPTQSYQTLELGDSPLDDEVDDNPMHELSRAWSAVYASSPDVVPVEPRHSAMAAMTVGDQVGQTETFRVLNSLSSVTNYTTVTGRLRYIGDDILVYVDTAMDDDEYLTDAEIDEMASNFETHSMAIERNLFGRESDVNADGKVTILMTPVLNEMCLPTGIVTGFFFPGDLYEQDSSNPASNAQEIFYTLVPDPEGRFCRALGLEFTMDNILPGVLAHEYQHMISFNQHVFLKGGSTEEPWLNESLSHLAEDITGHGLENYSRVKLFLDRANTTTLIPNGLPSLAERGMGYLFLRYLYEQVADNEAFMNSMLMTDKTGVGNIEAALAKAGASFSEFSQGFAHWQVALVLSGTGLTNDNRYNYQARRIDEVTGNYKGICIKCDSNDGRGTILDGPVMAEINSLPLTVDLESAGTRFLKIKAPGTLLSINGSSGINLGGALIRLEAN